MLACKLGCAIITTSKQTTQNRGYNMEISKTTFNFAEKRNIEIMVMDSEEGGILDISFVDEDGNCDESTAQYSIDDNNELFFHTSFNSNLEDLPKCVKNEKQLRELIGYIAKKAI